MGTFHKIFGIYRLGKDPDVRYTPGGVAVATFSAASDFSFKKDDEWVTETEWTRMVAFGKLGERIGQMAVKGTLLYAEGRLKTNKWEDKEGNTRYSTDMILGKVELLANYNKPDSDQSDGGGNQGGNERPPIDDTDIPF